MQNKRSDLVGESHPVASINSANLSNLLPNKQIYTDYSIVHNTESSEQENYMTAYLKDVLGHDQYKGKIDGSITKIVFARPPYLNVQYGIGSCVIEASIRSGTRVLVFQNKFEGHATGKSQAEPNELQKLACYDAVNKMLQEISL